MNEPTKQDKRIVSKSAFVVNTGKKAALTSVGIAVYIFGIGMCIVAIVCASMILSLWQSGWSAMSGALLATGILGGLSVALIYWGGKSIKIGKELDAGVPLTRANAVHLPAADSLVRASSEPVQDQGAVLLRAAGQGRDTLPASVHH